MNEKSNKSDARIKAKQEYRKKKKQLSIEITPEKAQDIKDCAALAGLSITQYLLMCHENYQQGK